MRYFLTREDVQQLRKLVSYLVDTILTCVLNHSIRGIYARSYFPKNIPVTDLT